MSSDAAVNPDTVLHSVGRVLDALDGLVREVDPAQLDRLSWCGVWTVRRLLNHMTYENLALAALAEGAAAMPTPDDTTDYLGGDHVAAFRASARRVLAALSAPGVLDRTYGPQQAPGAFIVQMLINEQLTHGWDLARATGQSTDIAPEIAAVAALAAHATRVGG